MDRRDRTRVENRVNSRASMQSSTSFGISLLSYNLSIMETTTALPTVLDDIIFRLTRRVQIERIYLFGSQASGKAQTDSDIDLLCRTSNRAIATSLRDPLL